MDKKTDWTEAYRSASASVPIPPEIEAAIDHAITTKRTLEAHYGIPVIIDVDPGIGVYDKLGISFRPDWDAATRTYPPND